MFDIYGLVLVTCANGLRLCQSGLGFFREFVQIHKLFNKSAISYRCVGRKLLTAFPVQFGAFESSLLRAVLPISFSEGAPQSGRAKSDRNRSRVSTFSRHFQGAFLRGEYPGLKPG